MAITVPPVHCLVWVTWNGRLQAERWGPDTTAGSKGDKVVVDHHELRPGEVGMSIAILEQRYPARTTEAQP